MSLWKKFVYRFSPFELALLAMISVLGIAVKPLAGTIAHIVTGPLNIPGGAVAGGLYMMWIVIGAGLTGKTGAGAMIGITQGILVLALGFYGSHGALSLITYTLPGISADLVLRLMRHKVCCPLCGFLAGAAANMTGTLLVAGAFFSLPWIALLLSLAVAALSGGLGGILAYSVVSRLRKMKIGVPEGDTGIKNGKEKGKPYE